MVYYQGDDIDFSIRALGAEWSDFTCVDIYFYTSEEHKVKYSSKYSSQPEYKPLTISDDFVKGVIPSDDTKLMRGNLIVEIHVQKQDGTDICKRKRTNVTIEKTTIKQEVI